LKDAIVSLILLDEKRGTHEEEVAASRFGWGKTKEEKEERGRLKEMQGLLKIERTKTSQVEGQFDEERRTGGIKAGMERLKIKLGGGEKS
jgi:hypothetical protein